jgi:hypothetical protein
MCIDTYHKLDMRIIVGKHCAKADTPEVHLTFTFRVVDAFILFLLCTSEQKYEAICKFKIIVRIID